LPPEQISVEKAISEHTAHTADKLMHDALGTSSEEEDEEEEGHEEERGEEDDGQQQPANYRFSLIFKLHFIFNY
jgi:hypothetical protein